MIGASRRMQSFDPVVAVLELAGLGHLMPNVELMFCPPRGPRSSRQCPTILGEKWLQPTDARIALSRGSAKNWLNQTTGLIVADAAGVLSPNGQIEPVETKLCPNLADWVGPARITVNTGKADLAGGTSAVEIVEDNTLGATHALGQPILLPAGTRVAASVFFKLGVNSNRHPVVWYGNAGGTAYCGLNLTTLALDQGATGDGVAPVDAIAVQYGQWVRLTFSCIVSATNDNCNFYIYMSTAGTIATFSYDGNSTSSLYCAHAMCAAASFTGVWTDGDAGTIRAADALSYTGISGLDSHGTMVHILRMVRSSPPPTFVVHGALNKNDTTPSVYFYTFSDGKIYANMANGDTPGTLVGTTYSRGDVMAVAAAWDTPDVFSVVVNGDIKAIGGGSVVVPMVGLNTLQVGKWTSANSPDGDEHLLTMLFDVRLSDDDMKKITDASVRNAIAVGL